jgi:hypothetical protein
LICVRLERDAESPSSGEYGGQSRAFRQSTEQVSANRLSLRNQDATSLATHNTNHDAL